MKSYMNAEQRTEFVTFGALLGYAQNVFLKKWEERYLTTDESERIKTSCDLLSTVFEDILDRMNTDYRDTIKRDLATTAIISVPQAKTEITLEKYTDLYHMVSIDKYILDTLIGVSLELCSRCYKTLEEQNTCLLRYCYTTANTPIYDSEAIGCPYKMEGVSVRNEFLRDFLHKFFLELESRGNVVSLSTEEQEVYSIDTSLNSLEAKEDLNPIPPDFEEGTCAG